MFDIRIKPYFQDTTVISKMARKHFAAIMLCAANPGIMDMGIRIRVPA